MEKYTVTRIFLAVRISRGFTPGYDVRPRCYCHLAGQKVNVAIGMRRSGKTYLCYQRMEELLDSGVEKRQLLYLSFEDERLLGFQASNCQSILDVYFALYPDLRERDCCFFFDEIQCVPGWERFIRRLLDTESVQLYLTGSSSKLLSTEIATSLRGRSLAVEVFPYSFREYLTSSGRFAALPGTFGSTTVAKLRNAMSAYLEQGGFPEVQPYSVTDRINVLQGYVDSVVLKDVVERHGATNLPAMRHMVAHVMAMPGGVFSVTKFYKALRSMQTSCTKNLLYEYVDHLVDAYLLQRVVLHSRSARARMVNPPKLYPIDTGLVHAMAYRNADNRGPLLESLVFLHLRRLGYALEYIRTRDGYECDFLATDRVMHERTLVQVCWSTSDSSTIKREVPGLTAAMKECGIDHGTIVTWDDEANLPDAIDVVPVWKWLLVSHLPT